MSSLTRNLRALRRMVKTEGTYPGAAKALRYAGGNRKDIRRNELDSVNPSLHIQYIQITVHTIGAFVMLCFGTYRFTHPSGL